METEAQAPEKCSEDLFLFFSIYSPWPLQAPRAALGAEDQVLRRMGWFPPTHSSQYRILRNRCGISLRKAGVEGRVRVCLENALRVAGGKGERKGWLGSLGWMCTHTAVFKWITNKDCPWSTGTFAQCYRAAWMVLIAMKKPTVLLTFKARINRETYLE